MLGRQGKVFTFKQPGLNAVGAYLKAARSQQDKTMRQVCEQTVAQGSGVSLEGYRKIEHGFVNPSEETLRKVCKALGLPFETALAIAQESYIVNQLGPSALESAKLSEDLPEFDIHWKRLTPEQRTQLMTMAQNMASVNLMSSKPRKRSA